MKKELRYNGKTLKEMSTTELEQQYKLNRERIYANGAFLGLVAGASLYYYPPVAVIPIGIGTIRIYWISKNNKLINEETNKRGRTLKK